MTMVDPIPVQNTGATSAAKPEGPTKSADGGSAFRALIEQLADRARELEKTSAKPVDATELAGAVEEAHGSLQDALSLSAQLIEAYRANMQQQPRKPGV
jgi:HPt (histidine-containing phosphotransfer) domain-containing protein